MSTELAERNDAEAATAVMQDALEHTQQQPNSGLHICCAANRNNIGIIKSKK
jgi:hypothetical protein